MPVFTLEAAHTYWKDYDDPIIYRVLSFMEAVETWTLDGNPALEQALKELGDALEGLAKFELEKEENYVKLLSQIKMTRMLYVMQMIDKTHPGSASSLLTHAEEMNKSKEALAALFLRRNMIFERLRLLSRVFASERFTIIQRALENEDEK